MFFIFLIFPSFFFPVVSKESRLAFAPPQQVFTSRPKERTDIFATLYFTFVSCADHFKGVFCSAFASLSQNFILLTIRHFEQGWFKVIMEITLMFGTQTLCFQSSMQHAT